MSGGGATIVTQTCPLPGETEAFAAWQNETSRVIEGFAGFVRQTVIPPSPPTQVDWVILQHFVDHASALAWLRSDARQARLSEVQSLVVGRDDVHVVEGDGAAATATPVSAVISTRVKPGQEAAYRRWEQRIAAAQARAPGFQGYRLSPPVAGVQEDWLAIVRFDTDAHLQAWLGSPERQALLKDSIGLVDEFHARIARTGFDQWFDVSRAPAGAPPVWKQNMLVLLMLYPVVFLFGTLIQGPLLIRREHMAFPVALFIGNVVSILLLNYLVPWTSQRFQTWLVPTQPATGLSEMNGTLLVLGLYAAMVLAFTAVF